MRNIKKIGIVGKRRSGRKTAAWLLATILELLHERKSREHIASVFTNCVDNVINDPNEAQSTQNYILDSFGGYILDSIRGLFGTLRECPLENTNWCKNNYINTQTYEIAEYDPDDSRLISVDDFIINFADNIMKRQFGRNFWLYSFEHNQIPTDCTRIFWDVKTNEERDYCEFIIHLICPGREVDGGYRTIDDPDADFVIDTRGGLKDSFEQFYNVALRLLDINFERDVAETLGSII